jgi:hypothetical protein
VKTIFSVESPPSGAAAVGPGEFQTESISRVKTIFSVDSPLLEQLLSALANFDLIYLFTMSLEALRENGIHMATKYET